jgi:hypothetical protein
MLGRCRTDWAVLLFGVRANNGIWYFKRTNQNLPGFVREVKPLVNIVEQLLELVPAEFLDESNFRVQVQHDFSEPVLLEDKSLATLYVATTQTQHDLDMTQWATLPELLRAMPRNKQRVAYLKAWQILSGAAYENVKVVESSELKV